MLFPGTNRSYQPSFNGGNVTFQVGDKVIYPNHGLGIVERIEEKTIWVPRAVSFTSELFPMTQRFWFLWQTWTTSVCEKPSATRKSIGLFTLLSDGKIDNHQNWKGRFKDNSDKMRTGSIYDMADVLKSLTFLSKSKSLSFREKRMLDRARALIISEVSEVMREKALEIEQRVDRALEKCFIVKVRNMTRQAARAKIAKPVKATVIVTRRAARAS